MIQEAIDQLNKINCTEYTGASAEALRAMDISDLESLLYRALDEEDKKDTLFAETKEDFEDMVTEYRVLRDSMSTLQDAIGNLNRHF